MNYFIFLSFSLLPYFFFFMYFEQARLAHKQHKNVFKIEIKADGDAVPTLDGNAIERGEPSLNESIIESQVSGNRSA